MEWKLAFSCRDFCSLIRNKLLPIERSGEPYGVMQEGFSVLTQRCCCPETSERVNPRITLRSLGLAAGAFTLETEQARRQVKVMAVGTGNFSGDS